MPREIACNIPLCAFAYGNIKEVFINYIVRQLILLQTINSGWEFIDWALRSCGIPSSDLCIDYLLMSRMCIPDYFNIFYTIP